MSALALPVILLLVTGIVAVLFAGWTARTLVDERWLPHLAFAWAFAVPFGLPVLLNLALVATIDRNDASPVVFQLSGAVIEFARYALLALMLLLIARRLPEASRRHEEHE